MYKTIRKEGSLSQWQLDYAEEMVSWQFTLNNNILEIQKKKKENTKPNVGSSWKKKMLRKRAFIYIHCLDLYEYSCPYSFETLYLFNLKGQCFSWEKLMQGKWVDYSCKNKYCFGTGFYTCVPNIHINQPPMGQCVFTMGSDHKSSKF